MHLLQFLLIVICILKISKEEVVEDEIKRLKRHYEFISEEIKPYLVFFDYEIPSEPSPLLRDSYDFIVIGSGATGSVIANRLSEIDKWNILLLEAGEEATIFTDVPEIDPAFQSTDCNWGYLMEKQDNFSLGMTDGRMNWPRGKALGGSTIVSSMIHTRGSKFDYDRWAALGNPGWSYRDVLPYFKKSEDSSLVIQDRSYHRAGGYLSVQDLLCRTEPAHAFIKAADECGYEYVDYNGKTQLGVSYVQATTKYGMRCSSERAFLQPIRHRPNLTILTKTFVTKILINRDTRTAYGIEYNRNGKTGTINASKEVILSAGVFNSPQLLMLSGIGPKDHLTKLEIPIMKELPVGQKLCDHIAFMGLTFTVKQPLVLLETIYKDPENYIQIFTKKNGPLTSPTGVEALAFLKTNISNYTENYPDIELIFTTPSFQLDSGEVLRKIYRISDDIYNHIWKPLKKLPVFSIIPVLLHPKSSGYLKLRSKNPFELPWLYGNFFTDSENQDVKTLIAAIREVQRIVAAPAFQLYGAQQVKTVIPGCRNYEFDSDPYWECALRHLSSSFHHPVATCKMGPSNDTTAIVDSKLRVYGIKNLRVVDTSIIPITLSGDINVPATMIGEKASDLIKDEWLKAEASIIDPMYIRRRSPEETYVKPYD